MQNKLFKKSSVERFSSPEKLNDYIQVSNPSSWMVLGAALALLAGVLIWGFFGELTQSVSFSGFVQEGILRCYVDSSTSAALEEGMEVVITPFMGAQEQETITGRVVSIADYPLSYEEASKHLEQEYLLAVLQISTWNIAVEIKPDETLYEEMIYTLSAVTNKQRPIDLVFQ